MDLDWHGLARPRQTLCVYMGLSVAGELTAKLVEAGLRSRTPAALIACGTTPQQRVIVGTLADLASRAAGIEGPALLIIGEVVAFADQSLGHAGSAKYRARCAPMRATASRASGSSAA